MSTNDEGRPDSLTLHHNSPYHGKDIKLPAKCIYLYYLTRANSQGHPRLQVFVWLLKPGDQIDWSDEGKVQEILTSLVTKAKNGVISPAGWNVGDVRWRRKSLFAVVLDDEEDKLIKGDAVRFRHHDDQGNKTFRDGRDTTLPGLNNVTAFYCLNHMKKHPTDADLGKGFDEFFVDFRTVKHPHHPPVLSHNDSGTNTGPPLG